MSKRSMKIMREQHGEMSATFAGIRQKIAEAQEQIREFTDKANRLEEEKQGPVARINAAHARCTELRNKIADRERELFDIENQIPLAKSKMHELEALHGENTYFKKTLERTRKELEETTKRSEDANYVAKKKSEESWQAAQRFHKLEIDLQEVDHRLDMAMRRILVARDKLAIAQGQTSSVSKNYEEMSKGELEGKLDTVLAKADAAKKRCQVAEEREAKLTARVEELEHGIADYQNRMFELFNGQRDLASSKIL